MCQNLPCESSSAQCKFSEAQFCAKLRLGSWGYKTRSRGSGCSDIAHKSQHEESCQPPCSLRWLCARACKPNGSRARQAGGGVREAGVRAAAVNRAAHAPLQQGSDSVAPAAGFPAGSASWPWPGPPGGPREARRRCAGTRVRTRTRMHTLWPVGRWSETAAQ